MPLSKRFFVWFNVPTIYFAFCVSKAYIKEFKKNPRQHCLVSRLKIKIETSAITMSELPD